jgi:hypothetical protein
MIGKKKEKKSPVLSLKDSLLVSERSEKILFALGILLPSPLLPLFLLLLLTDYGALLSPFLLTPPLNQERWKNLWAYNIEEKEGTGEPLKVVVDFLSLSFSFVRDFATHKLHKYVF